VTEKKIGRPKKSQARKLSTMIGVRLRDDLVEKLDAKARELEKDHPEIDWNRGQVIRHLIYKGLLEEE